jgi:hypothetical protein
MASLDTTTLTWGFRDRWSSSGMRAVCQRMFAQPLAGAGDCRGSAKGGLPTFAARLSYDKSDDEAVLLGRRGDVILKPPRRRAVSPALREIVIDIAHHRPERAR